MVKHFRPLGVFSPPYPPFLIKIAPKEAIPFTLRNTELDEQNAPRDEKRWRIKQIDELDDGELDEQKCT